MDIKFKRINGYKKTNCNMVRMFAIDGSNLYKKSKIMSIMNSRNKTYYKQSYQEHLEDIEQTLIDYGIFNESLFISLWVSNCDLPMKVRSENFGVGILKLAFGFNRFNSPLQSIEWSKISKEKIEERRKVLNKDIVSLQLARRISDINYAINNMDGSLFKIYMNNYEIFRDSLYLNVEEHKNMWEYLEFVTDDCGGDLNIINGYF